MDKWVSERKGLNYEVFGRGKPDEPLSHIGSLTAPNIALAKSRAKMMYAERQWIELSVVRSNEFMRLIGGSDASPVGFA
jgi:1,2-phenylacetyl-CoA epoxidase PaaB subunit